MEIRDKNHGLAYVVAYGQTGRRRRFVPPGLFRRLLEAWVDGREAGIHTTMLETLFGGYLPEEVRNASTAARLYLALSRKRALDYLDSVKAILYAHDATGGIAP